MYLPAFSTAIRVAFRIIFFILSVYLGAVGSYCNKLSLKLRLLQKGRVPVQEAAGWVQGTAIFEPLYRARRIPDWKWWTLMAAVLVLVKINDLITNTIRTVNVPSFCLFETGLVLSKIGLDAFITPPWNSRSQLVAGNAQLRSSAYGCQQGIYKKVNLDIRFCAAESDIIGSWNCKAVGTNVTYPYGSREDHVADDLRNNGFLYPSTPARARTYNTSNALEWTHLVLWNSNVNSNSSGTVFDIKAAVDTTANVDDNKVMYCMHCQLGGSEQVMKIVQRIPSEPTLRSWVNLLQGYMYDGFGSGMIDNPEETLAWLLNSIAMVAGGSDTLLQAAPEDDLYQGCLLPQTYIPGPVVAFLAITVLSCAGMSCFTFVLYLRLRAHGNKSLVEHAPVDRWSWMGHAAAESNAAASGPVYPVRARDLSMWHIARDPGPSIKLVKEHSEGDLLTSVQPKEESIPMMPVG